MSIKKDSEEASRQLDEFLYPNGKKPFDRKRFKPKKIYGNLEPISNDEWSEVSKGISAKGMVGIALLPKFRSNYEAGYYPSKEEFIETLNALYENLFKCHNALEDQSVTDNEVFDDLFEEYNDILNQRTMDYGVADKLLRHKAFKVQKRIEMYLEKKVKAGETLTDEMLGFKTVDELKKNMHFQKVILPQLPKPPKDPTTEKMKSFYDMANKEFEEEESKPTKLEDVSKTKEKYNVRRKPPEEPPVQKGDGELAAAHIIIKKLKSEKKALAIRKNKPETKMEMIKVINRNLKKNGKCNNEACGRDLKVDGETIKRWIESFGLSRYAYNPDHRKQ